MDQVGHPIPIKPTQPKSRYSKTCHNGKKPCGISLIKYLWRCELAEFGLSSCFSSILTLAYLVSQAMITKMIRNKRQNHSTYITFQIKETLPVLSI